MREIEAWGWQAGWQNVEGGHLLVMSRQPAAEARSPGPKPNIVILLLCYAVNLLKPAA
jgi:hypothetical protein